LSKTINPTGAIESFAPFLQPIAKLDFGSARGSKRDVVRSENYQRGHTQGFDQGLIDGAAAAKEEFEAAHRGLIMQFAAELQTRADQVDLAFEAWCTSLETPLAELAAAVAARVVARELTTDPNTILDIARTAIADVTHATSARIRVNPFDAPVIREYAVDLQAAASSLRSVEIVEDPSILGGCVIETDGGSVDARVDSMIAQARKAIRGDS
jgi:flagellar assembly protein FliH